MDLTAVTQCHTNLILHNLHERRTIRYCFDSCCFHPISVLPFHAVWNISIFIGLPSYLYCRRPFSSPLYLYLIGIHPDHIQSLRSDPPNTRHLHKKHHISYTRKLCNPSLVPHTLQMDNLGEESHWQCTVFPVQLTYMLDISTCQLVLLNTDGCSHTFHGSI